jgi:ribonuclease BN (tRNA processing enzyme)
MRVRLLPSCLPGSGASGPQFLSSYLVDDSLVIDAGSIGLQADMAVQRRVQHVFLTHGHLDHVASLPLLVENLYEPGPDCIEVLASTPTLDLVRANLFNHTIWPDFFALSATTPDGDRFVRATPIEPFVAVERGGFRVTPVPVSHGTDTLAMVVDDGRSCVAFAADTGPTDALWQHLTAHHADRLAAVFLECSFPDSLAGLAAHTGHHCPRSFAAECAKIPPRARVIVTHRKARFAAEIARELAALALPRVALVEPGRDYLV